MKVLNDFLQRFQNLTPPDQALRKAAAEAIRQIAGVPVSYDAVSIARSTVFVKCSSVAKSTIRALRADIFKEIERRLPSAAGRVRDIR